MATDVKLVQEQAYTLTCCYRSSLQCVELLIPQKYFQKLFSKTIFKILFYFLFSKYFLKLFCPSLLVCKYFAREFHTLNRRAWMSILAECLRGMTEMSRQAYNTNRGRRRVLNETFQTCHICYCTLALGRLHYPIYGNFNCERESDGDSSRESFQT